MNKSLLKAAVICGLAAIAMGIHAQDKGAMEMGNMNSMKMDCMQNMEKMKGMKMACMGKSSPNGPSNKESMSSGEVKAVDSANNTITLRHGPIKSKTVDMGAMTMTFPVQKPALLARVKVGNKVKFIVEDVNNVATVTSLVIQK